MKKKKKKFCVSYDLKDSEYRTSDYESIKERLLDLNGKDIQKSVWLLELAYPWDCKRLKEYLEEDISEDDDDGLFIAIIDPDHDHVLINPITSPD
jgi:CRISPR/Cas system-associated endoribonuclease Cas2